MSQRELGRADLADIALSQMQQFVDKQAAQDGAATVVDIYSKFGEDGSSDTIKAANLYIQGLVCLAKGEKAAAKDSFTKSLKLNPSDVWAKYYLSTCK